MPVMPNKTFSFTSRRTPILRLFVLLAFILFALNAHTALYSGSLSLSNSKEQRFSTRCCGPGCRQPLNETVHNITAHYDSDYFQWQTRLGLEKAAVRDWNRFLNVKPTDTVADLGAGGGHILASLNASRRIAVEINHVARASIHDKYSGQIETFAYPELVPDNSVDVLYSTSAIEHFECPLTELREMARKVRKGGRVIIGIKNEGVQYAGSVNRNDKDQHLYTWNRQLLFNFLQSAGFHVTSVDPHISEVRTKGRAWNHPNNFTSASTYIYHWARGIKRNL